MVDNKSSVNILTISTGIWFNEYDGPRTRKVYVRVMG